MLDAQWDQRLFTLDPVAVAHIMNRSQDYQKPWQSRRLITSLIGCGKSTRLMRRGCQYIEFCLRSSGRRGSTTPCPTTRVEPNIRAAELESLDSYATSKGERGLCRALGIAEGLLTAHSPSCAISGFRYSLPTTPQIRWIQIIGLDERPSTSLAWQVSILENTITVY